MTPDEKERSVNYKKQPDGTYTLTEAGLKTIKDNMQITFELMEHFSVRLDIVEKMTFGQMTEHEPLNT